MTPNRVAHLPWDEVARRMAEGAVAVLPVGAGAKEHGRHLPMNTDQIQAEWLADAVAAHMDALVWPTLTYGFYPAFTAYPGSISLSAATFQAVLHELCAGLLKQGARAVLILDTGLSTIPPIDDLLAQMGDRRLHHLKVYDGPRYRETSESLEQQSHGTHADELETSHMLALVPEQVDMSRAEASPNPGPLAGPLTPCDPDAPGYSPGGSYGDPTLATREKGDALLKAMVADVIEMAQRAVADKGTGPVL